MRCRRSSHFAGECPPAHAIECGWITGNYCRDSANTGATSPATVRGHRSCIDVRSTHARALTRGRAASPPTVNVPPTQATGARCAFCGHVNPPDARYCNECAADLKLTLCEQCSAVNRQGMSNCHKCGARLVDPKPALDDAVVQPGPTVIQPQPEAALEPSLYSAAPPPRRGGWVAALLVVVAVALGAWYFSDGLRDTTPLRTSSHADTVPPATERPAEVVTPTERPAEVVAPTERPAKVMAPTERRAEVVAPMEQPAERVAPTPAPAEAPPAAPLAPAASPPPPPKQEPASSCSDALNALALCDRSKPNASK